MRNKLTSVTLNDGAVMLAATVMLALFLAIAGFSFDLGRAYLEMRRIQQAADAGALAGARLFSAVPQGTKQQAIDRAVSIAAQNGVTIANSAVLTGRWRADNPADPNDLPYFHPDETPYNSVSIDLSSVVPTLFARFVRVFSFAPAVSAVSLAFPPDNSGCVRPFGISHQSFPAGSIPLTAAPLPYAYSPALTFDVLVSNNSPGNWGKIDLLDANGNPINNSSGAPNTGFPFYMTNGVCGSASVLNDPDPPDAGPGNSQYCNTLSSLAQQGAPFYFFVTNQFPNGSHPVELRRYARGKVNSCTGQGPNTTVNLTVYEVTDTLPNGGVLVPGQAPKLAL